MDDLFVGTDNLIKLSGLRNTESDEGSYINDADVEMSLYDGTPFNPSVGAAASVSEVQSITPNAVATGGHFHLVYNGATTGEIAFDATVAEVQDYLLALAPVDTGDIVVTGDTFDVAIPLNGMIFTFADTLGDVHPLTMDVSALTGVTSTVILEVTKGAIAGDSVSEVQNIIPDAPSTAGHFHITYKGQTTAALDWDTDLGALTTALEGLSTIGAGNVVCTGDEDGFSGDPVEGGVYCTFADTFGDAEMMTMDVSALTGVTYTVITEDTKGVLDGVAIDETGGKVGIPILNHNIIATDRVRIEGTQKYNGEYTVDSVLQDKIVITATYVAETFNGGERVYVGVRNGTEITLAYVEKSDGVYIGVIPDDLENIDVGNWYYLFVAAVKDANVLLTRSSIQAKYYPEDQWSH